jgi:hypothetical protein
VLQFPATELEYWSLYFSIDDNQNTPTIKQEDITVEDSIKGFKEIWS